MHRRATCGGHQLSCLFVQALLLERELVALLRCQQLPRVSLMLLELAKLLLLLQLPCILLLQLRQLCLVGLLLLQRQLLQRQLLLPLLLQSQLLPLDSQPVLRVWHSAVGRGATWLGSRGKLCKSGGGSRTQRGWHGRLALLRVRWCYRSHSHSHSHRRRCWWRYSCGRARTARPRTWRVRRGSRAARS